MKKMRLVLGIVVWVAIVSPLRADIGSGAITVTGSVQKPGEWTADRLKTEFAADISTISYTSHDGQKHTSTAVPLISLLKAVGLETQLKTDPTADPKTKHYDLRFAVAVVGHDGYVAAFSLAELQADLGNRHVWLALDADGQPLAATEGPVKLIALDDKKPARWVHGVQSISVVNVAPPTTKPAG